MGASCCSARDNHGGGRSKARIKAVSDKSRAALTQLQQRTKQMEMMVEKIIALGKPWTDPEFPPKSSSLYDP